MVRKSRSAKTGNSAVSAVVDPEKGSPSPLPVILYTVDIIHCSIERKVPRSQAVKGKVKTELSVNIEIDNRNGRECILGLLKAQIKGRTLDTENPIESFAASFVLEGLFYPEDKTVKLSEEHLDRNMVKRIVQELHPITVLRTSELLSMMGYGGVRLIYGLQSAKFDEMERETT